MSEKLAVEQLARELYYEYWKGDQFPDQRSMGEFKHIWDSFSRGDSFKERFLRMAQVCLNRRPTPNPLKSDAGLVEKIEKAFPDNWLDPLLTGPNKALFGKAGTWDCQDIERLVKAIKERVLASLRGKEGGGA